MKNSNNNTFILRPRNRVTSGEVTFETMKKDVLGVKIDDVVMDQALDIVQEWLKGQDKSFGKAQDKHYIVTPNPEFLLSAQTDSLFRKILNEADLSIPDGIGLRLSGKIRNTFSGTDFMEELVELAAEKGYTTGFLGGREGAAEKCAGCLLRKYPKLKISFADSGGEVDNNGNVIARSSSLKNDEAIFRGRLPRPFGARNDDGVDILFVAFGHIKQEKWIVKNLDKIPVKLAMGVGGAFDYFSGKIPRAPFWIRNLGLEWLFRLFIQPWRIKRQIALLKYLWLLVMK